MFGLPFDLKELIAGCSSEISSCSINLTVFRAMDAARDTNRFLTSAEPWKMKGSDQVRRPAIVRTTLEAIFAFMHFLAPVIPLAAKKVYSYLVCDLAQMNLRYFSCSTVSLFLHML